MSQHPATTPVTAEEARASLMAGTKREVADYLDVLAFWADDPTNTPERTKHIEMLTRVTKEVLETK